MEEELRVSGTCTEGRRSCSAAHRQPGRRRHRHSASTAREQCWSHHELPATTVSGQKHQRGPLDIQVCTKEDYSWPLVCSSTLPCEMYRPNQVSAELEKITDTLVRKCITLHSTLSPSPRTIQRNIDLFDYRFLHKGSIRLYNIPSHLSTYPDSTSHENWRPSSSQEDPPHQLIATNLRSNLSSSDTCFNNSQGDELSGFASSTISRPEAHRQDESISTENTATSMLTQLPKLERTFPQTPEESEKDAAGGETHESHNILVQSTKVSRACKTDFSVIIPLLH